MKKWEYDISFYSLKELGIPEDETDFSPDQIIACDTEGHCFYNDIMRLYLDKFKNLLNNKGLDGWELTQAGYHKGSLVCFWKREI